MTTQRELRIEQLVKWAEEHYESWITEYVKDMTERGYTLRDFERSYEIGHPHRFYIPGTINEARKRWAVSHKTADDYADIVGRRMAPKYTAQLKAITGIRGRSD